MALHNYPSSAAAAAAASSCPPDNRMELLYSELLCLCREGHYILDDNDERDIEVAILQDPHPQQQQQLQQYSSYQYYTHDASTSPQRQLQSSSLSISGSPTSTIFTLKKPRDTTRPGVAVTTHHPPSVFKNVNPHQTTTAEHHHYPHPTACTTTATTTTATTAPPTSEYVLNVAFYSFVGFMIVQGFTARYFAHSSAMMADCAAMSIDALTYLFNLLAERQKQKIHHNTTTDQQHGTKIIQYYYEFLPPTLSVMTLIAVTVTTLQSSLTTMVHTTTTTTTSAGENVSVPIMLVFSFLNLVLDLLNVTCFARSGFVSMSAATAATTKIPCTTSGCGNTHHPTRSHDDDETSPLLLVAAAVPVTTSSEDQPNDRVPHNKVNLNMCSAWTHICADTMRSVAVLLAAGIALCLPTHGNPMLQQYYAVQADAGAAVVVSIIVLLSIVPLLRGIVRTGRDIFHWHWEHCHFGNVATASSSCHTV